MDSQLKYSDLYPFWDDAKPAARRRRRVAQTLRRLDGPVRLVVDETLARRWGRTIPPTRPKRWVTVALEDGRRYLCDRNNNRLVIDDWRPGNRQDDTVGSLTSKPRLNHLINPTLDLVAKPVTTPLLQG